MSSANAINADDAARRSASLKKFDLSDPANFFPFQAAYRADLDREKLGRFDSRTYQLAAIPDLNVIIPQRPDNLSDANWTKLKMDVWGGRTRDRPKLLIEEEAGWKAATIIWDRVWIDGQEVLRPAMQIADGRDRCIAVLDKLDSAYKPTGPMAISVCEQDMIKVTDYPPSNTILMLNEIHNCINRITCRRTCDISLNNDKDDDD